MLLMCTAYVIYGKFTIVEPSDAMPSESLDLLFTEIFDIVSVRSESAYFRVPLENFTFLSVIHDCIMT